MSARIHTQKSARSRWCWIRKRTERGARKERYIEAEQDSAERTRKGEVICKVMRSRRIESAHASRRSDELLEEMRNLVRECGVDRTFDLLIVRRKVYRSDD